MKSSGGKAIEISELILRINEDRALILEKIDQGCWPELRNDLAALERELGQLLNIASEKFHDSQ